MARLARAVIPDLPHHITQRGNRREPVFFEEGDYRLYLGLIGDAATRSGPAIAKRGPKPKSDLGDAQIGLFHTVSR
jgi:hypothetical protein